MTNILKKATFGLWIFLLITMIAATIIEKLYNHRFVNILLRLSFLYRSLDSHNITFITLYHQAPYHKE